MTSKRPPAWRCRTGSAAARSMIPAWISPGWTKRSARTTLPPATTFLTRIFLATNFLATNFLARIFLVRIRRTTTRQAAGRRAQKPS